VPTCKAVLLRGRIRTVSDVVKAKIGTFEAKDIGTEAKAFKDTTRAEIKICSRCDRIHNELSFDCFCLGIYY